MNALKKVLVAALVLGLVIACTPSTNVYAASALATYSFDSLDGMTDAGLGTIPAIASDAERGNVLQFKDGEASTFVTDANSDPGEHVIEVQGGSPSALKIPNPYENGAYQSMAISYWVKVTDQNAADKGAGIFGFKTAEYTATHPDNRATGKNVDWFERGCYVYGMTTAMSWDQTVPLVNFAGLYHNWYCYFNDSFDYNDSTWHHIILTTDSSNPGTKVYVDGQDMGGTGSIGKRWNKGELDPTNPANCDEPTLMETICWAGTELYLGQTGISMTSSGVFIDDFTLWDAGITDAQALSMYEEAKAGTAIVTNGSSTSGAGNDATNGGSSSTVSSGSTAKKSTGTSTAALPQTGVVGTATLVGLGVAAVGAGLFLMKKKEEK